MTTSTQLNTSTGAARAVRGVCAAIEDCARPHGEFRCARNKHLVQPAVASARETSGVRWLAGDRACASWRTGYSLRRPAELARCAHSDSPRPLRECPAHHGIRASSGESQMLQRMADGTKPPAPSRLCGVSVAQPRTVRAQRASSAGCRTNTPYGRRFAAPKAMPKLNT